jgi:hypothetical protein
VTGKCFVQKMTRILYRFKLVVFGGESDRLYSRVLLVSHPGQIGVRKCSAGANGINVHRQTHGLYIYDDGRMLRTLQTSKAAFILPRLFAAVMQNMQY